MWHLICFSRAPWENDWSNKPPQHSPTSLQLYCALWQHMPPHTRLFLWIVGTFHRPNCIFCPPTLTLHLPLTENLLLHFQISIIYYLFFPSMPKMSGFTIQMSPQCSKNTHTHQLWISIAEDTNIHLSLYEQMCKMQPHTATFWTYKCDCILVLVVQFHILSLCTKTHLNRYVLLLFN